MVLAVIMTVKIMRSSCGTIISVMVYKVFLYKSADESLESELSYNFYILSKDVFSNNFKRSVLNRQLAVFLISI